jgi:hypothetical protein
MTTEETPNGGVDAAARIQIDNRQVEIGNVFTPPPLASNDLLGGTLRNPSADLGSHPPRAALFGE